MAHALKKIGFDLLLVGGLSDDGSTGATPGALAEYLQTPLVTNARKAEVADGKLKIERETDTGYQDVIAPLPCVMTTALTFGEPRYASLKGIMGAKKKTIAALTRRAISDSRTAGRRKPDRRRSCWRLRRRPCAAKAKSSKRPTAPSGAQAIFDFLKEKKLV